MFAFPLTPSRFESGGFRLQAQDSIRRSRDSQSATHQLVAAATNSRLDRHVRFSLTTVARNLTHWLETVRV